MHLPNTALAAICLFMLLQKTVSQDRPLPLWVQLTDKYSFGIYLVHILPLNYIHPMLSKHMNTLWVIPLATLLTLLSSIGIIILLRKLPYGKYVSG
ncbi:acyltransferase family protein [Sphingobacterium sp. T2]|uniref:acyltransferase family protein n=1 Tax=Sphingobacterium sp. T2 TaxID=1590596 RepID=UPI001E31480C|nr:acyltransferase family protein [Sphingobacterium sp. T2]